MIRNDPWYSGSSIYSGYGEMPYRSFVEAQLLEAIEIDYIDESEVLSPADDVYHIDKTKFRVPFVCGAKDLGEALRRINEGASMIRTKGEPGTGDVVQAVRHMRMMNSAIAKISAMREDELFDEAKQLRVPYELVQYVHEHKRLPVVNFAAGGVATPADAALMMQLGAEGVFVGSGIFKSGNPGETCKCDRKSSYKLYRCEDDRKNFLRILEKLWLVLMKTRLNY